MSAQSLARALSTLQRFMYWHDEPSEQYKKWELSILYRIRFELTK